MVIGHQPTTGGPILNETKEGFQHQKTWGFTKMCVKLLIHVLSTSDGWIFIMIYRYLSVILDITWDFTWDRYLLLSIVMDIVMDE